MSSLSGGQSGTGSPWEKPQTPRFGQRVEREERAPLACVPWANSREGTSRDLQSPMGPHLTPALVASWEKNERLWPSSLGSPGEGAVTTGVMAAQAWNLCGQEGDLSGGD